MNEIVIVSPYEAFIYMPAINKSIRLWESNGKIHILLMDFLEPLGPYVGLPLNFKLLDLEHDTTHIDIAA